MTNRILFVSKTRFALFHVLFCNRRIFKRLTSGFNSLLIQFILLLRISNSRRSLQSCRNTEGLSRITLKRGEIYSSVEQPTIFFVFSWNTSVCCSWKSESNLPFTVNVLLSACRPTLRSYTKAKQRNALSAWCTDPKQTYVLMNAIVDRSDVRHAFLPRNFL